MIPQPVAKAFGLEEYRDIQTIESGLINSSYKISIGKEQSFFLQKINTDIFKNPADIQHNYSRIRSHLLLKNSFALPAIIPAINNSTFYQYENESWRCFQFIDNTYSISTAETATKAYEVAHCFGRFTADLIDLNPSEIKTILPDFHNPGFRFRQFETALQQTEAGLKKEAAYLIENVLSRVGLIKWYESIESKPQQFPKHILHHDCKIANILFEKETGRQLFPIDLDTTQPGYFFSDLGDMVRSMVPNFDENFVHYNELELRTDFYTAILQGYLDAMGEYLTENERADIILAGPVVIYMQAVRFVTDFLNNNTYYKVSYPSQNKDRALNQFRLLELLEKYLQLKY